MQLQLSTMHVFGYAIEARMGIGIELRLIATGAATRAQTTGTSRSAAPFTGRRLPSADSAYGSNAQSGKTVDVQKRFPNVITSWREKKMQSDSQSCRFSPSLFDQLSSEMWR
jgi:hypothetical protein